MAAYHALPESACHADKVRVVFEEFDQQRTRGIVLDQWLATFQRLRLDFTPATVHDLFEKTDVNRDGLVSIPEFERFGELYPTLLDSLYFRIKDYWGDVHQLENIEASRATLGSLRMQEDRARRAYIEAQHDSDEQERRVQLQLAHVAEAQAREAEAKANLEAAHTASELGRSDVRERTAELAASRDHDRMRQAQLADASRNVEHSAAQVRASDANVAQAEERLRSIERMLIDQRNEVDSLRAISERHRADLAHAQALEQEAHACAVEAQRAVQMASDRLLASESELALRGEREREAAAALSMAAAETSHQMAQKEVEQRELMLCKEREVERRALEDAARCASEDQERVIAALEAQNADFNLQRKEVEAEERPLLDQEVRLREQRDCLEEKESQLRKDVHLFTSHTGRSPSPLRVLHPSYNAKPISPHRYRY